MCVCAVSARPLCVSLRETFPFFVLLPVPGTQWCTADFTFVKETEVERKRARDKH